MFFLLFLDKVVGLVGGGSEYQRGLPRLVFVAIVETSSLQLFVRDSKNWTVWRHILIRLGLGCG